MLAFSSSLISKNFLEIFNSDIFIACEVKILSESERHSQHNGMSEFTLLILVLIDRNVAGGKWEEDIGLLSLLTATALVGGGDSSHVDAK